VGHAGIPIAPELIESLGMLKVQSNISANGSDSERFITKIEIAARIGKTTRTVDAWMAAGILPYFKVGRSVLFDWSDVRRHLNEKFHVSRFNTTDRNGGAHE
jgi:excisionase family DNA binding protein